MTYTDYKQILQHRHHNDYLYLLNQCRLVKTKNHPSDISEALHNHRYCYLQYKSCTHRALFAIVAETMQTELSQQFIGGQRVIKRFMSYPQGFMYIYDHPLDVAYYKDKMKHLQRYRKGMGMNVLCILIH